MVSTGILGNAYYFSKDVRDTYVRIDDDKQAAWLYLGEKEDGSPYCEDELIRMLVENSVIYGIKHSALVAMVKKGVYHREIMVAEADRAEEGKDGYYEFTFDINGGTSKPVIREDGSVDYQSMKMVNSVEAGTLLATYHHAVPGKNGKDVCGNEISVPLVRELPPLAGRGVYQAQNNPDQYYAEKSGKVEYSSGKLSIVNILEFSGDVDQNTGKLEFFGDIHIQGNVTAGTTIRAGKSLTIDGTVEAADLYAGGDIILKRGVQGSQKAHIGGRGNLYADFIEHSFVKVEGDIEANYILSSYITTPGAVKLSGKRASLIGGSVYATHGITCNSVGNSTEIKTKLACGVSEEMQKENEKILAELKAVRGEIQKIRDDVASLGSRITPQLQESYKYSLQKQMAKQKNILEAQKQLYEKMEEARNTRIVVNEDVNIGTEITIDMNTLQVDKRNHSVEYKNIAGMITAKVLVYN